MRRFLIPLVFLLAVAGFLFWWFSPGQVVKRRTATLFSKVTLEAGTPATSRALNSYTLEQLLGPRVSLSATAFEEANGSFERSELISAFQAVCQQVKETKFHIRRIESIQIDGTRATVVAALDALVAFPSYQPANGPAHATLVWRQADDGWRLESLVWQDDANP